MLYHTQSPYFRQFLASTTTKFYINNLESILKVSRKLTNQLVILVEEMLTQDLWEYDLYEKNVYISLYYSSLDDKIRLFLILSILFLSNQALYKYSNNNYYDYKNTWKKTNSRY